MPRVVPVESRNPWFRRIEAPFGRRIPETGSASSLDLACSATAALYEMDRQRRGGARGAASGGGA